MKRGALTTGPGVPWIGRTDGYRCFYWLGRRLSASTLRLRPSFGRLFLAKANLFRANPQNRRYTRVLMSHRGTPFRALLTVVLAIMLPLCCCNFHGWVLSHLSCEVPAAAASSLANAWSGTINELDLTDDRISDAADECCSKSQPSGGQDAENRSADKDHDRNHSDRHECDCGKNSVKMLAAATATLELQAPVVIAILAWLPATGTAAYVSFPAKGADSRPHERPPSSLVHMHCALNV